MFIAASGICSTGPARHIGSKVGMVAWTIGQASLFAQTSPVPRGPGQPFVRARDEEIGAELGDGDILDAEPVDSVDRQQGLPLGRLAAVVRADRLGDRGDRHFDAGARMDPGDRQQPRVVAQVAADIADDLVDADLGRVGVERRLADLGPGPLGGIVGRQSRSRYGRACR